MSSSKSSSIPPFSFPRATCLSLDPDHSSRTSVSSARCQVQSVTSPGSYQSWQGSRASGLSFVRVGLMSGHQAQDPLSLPRRESNMKTRTFSAVRHRIQVAEMSIHKSTEHVLPTNRRLSVCAGYSKTCSASSLSRLFSRSSNGPPHPCQGTVRWRRGPWWRPRSSTATGCRRRRLP